MKLNGEEHEDTLTAANNYALGLVQLVRIEEAKSLLRKMIPVARDVLGKNHDLTLKMRWIYTGALCRDGATLDDLSEAATTLEELERTSRRVFGGSHPFTVDIEASLKTARAALRARETPPPQTPRLSN